MCGIYGIVNFNGKPVRKELLFAMGEKMRHRGPDGEGHIIFDKIGIGMRRLAIIDPSGGQQPISNEDGSIYIILNGEIYNHTELRSELLLRGHQFRTKSDVECVVHLYEEMGTACINRLNGMFAFALFDKKQNRLWLARDRLGIKPLFYSKTDEQFVFSSDLNAIKKIKNVKVKEEALIKYLGFSYVPEPETIYHNVCKLGCAEQIIIENSNLKLSSYWPPFNTSPFFGSIQEATSRLETIIVESSKLQIRSDVPIGVFLSGGIDSSLIVPFVARLNTRDTIKTFTINFLGKESQDSKYAKIIADSINAKHETIDVNSSNLAHALDELLPFMDEPLSDSAIVPTYMISKHAKEKGIKVLLSGAGGDEVFGGYKRHFPMRFGSAAWIAQHKLVRNLFKIITKYSHPHLSWRLASPFARNFGISISGANLEFLNKAFNNSENFHNLLSSYENMFYEAISTKIIDRMRLDLQTYLPNNIMSLTDKGSFSRGSCPLLDHRLVEFAFSLPSDFNPLGGKDKGLF